MTVDSSDFRDALRHFPSGVTIVTVLDGEGVHGLTVSAFCSVSPEPPLVLLVIDHRHTAYELLERHDAVFAVNVLGEGQAPLSERFAWVDTEDRFRGGDWEPAPSGAPVLTDALAWLDCRVVDRRPAGTHSIYVGEVTASAVPRPGARPLVYWNRAYRGLADDPVES